MSWWSDQKRKVEKQVKKLDPKRVAKKAWDETWRIAEDAARAGGRLQNWWAEDVLPDPPQWAKDFFGEERLRHYASGANFGADYWAARERGLTAKQAKQMTQRNLRQSGRTIATILATYGIGSYLGPAASSAASGAATAAGASSGVAGAVGTVAGATATGAASGALTGAVTAGAQGGSFRDIMSGAGTGALYGGAAGAGTSLLGVGVNAAQDYISPATTTPATSLAADVPAATAATSAPAQAQTPGLLNSVIQAAPAAIQPPAPQAPPPERVRRRFTFLDAPGRYDFYRPGGI